MNHNKRAPGLIAIVAYKAFTASLLAVTAVALFLTLNNYQSLDRFAEDYALTGKREIIIWVLEKITTFDPKTIKYSGLLAAAYSIVTAIEAVGLWYQKVWATILVLVLVGVSIPVEIVELIKGISLLKLIVFLVNAAVFWYLLRHAIKAKNNGVD